MKKLKLSMVKEFAHIIKQVGLFNKTKFRCLDFWSKNLSPKNLRKIHVSKSNLRKSVYCGNSLIWLDILLLLSLFQSLFTPAHKDTSTHTTNFRLSKWWLWNESVGLLIANWLGAPCYREVMNSILWGITKLTEPGIFFWRMLT